MTAALAARETTLSRLQWLAVPAALLVLWQVLAWWIDYAVVSPWGTVVAIGMGWQRGWLLPAFASTMKATAMGFVIAGTFGILFGFLIGRSRFWTAVLEEPLLWIYSIPKVVLYPILVLLLGLGLKSSVAFAILQGIFPPLLILCSAVREIPAVYVKAARMQRLPALAFFRQIVLPYTLPAIAMGLRYCFCLTYIGVVVAQMFASEDGAGFELIKAISLQQSGKMFAIVAVTMAIALVVNFAFLLLEQRARIHRPDYAARFSADA